MDCKVVLIFVFVNVVFGQYQGRYRDRYRERNDPDYIRPSRRNIYPRDRPLTNIFGESRSLRFLRREPRRPSGFRSRGRSYGGYPERSRFGSYDFDRGGSSSSYGGGSYSEPRSTRHQLYAPGPRSESDRSFGHSSRRGMFRGDGGSSRTMYGVRGGTTGLGSRGSMFGTYTPGLTGGYGSLTGMRSTPYSGMLSGGTGSTNSGSSGAVFGGYNSGLTSSTGFGSSPYSGSVTSTNLRSGGSLLGTNTVGGTTGVGSSAYSGVFDWRAGATHLIPGGLSFGTNTAGTQGSINGISASTLPVTVPAVTEAPYAFPTGNANHAIPTAVKPGVGQDAGNTAVINQDSVNKIIEDPPEIRRLLGSSILGREMRMGENGMPRMGGAGFGEAHSNGLNRGWDGNPQTLGNQFEGMLNNSNIRQGHIFPQLFTGNSGGLYQASNMFRFGNLQAVPMSRG